MPKKTGEDCSLILREWEETPAQNFKFLLKSIWGVFSNVMVKCEFILIKLTG